MQPNMGERRFCEYCQIENTIIFNEKQTTRTFRKEPFEIIEKYAVCSSCGQEIYDEECANHTMMQLSKLYQDKHSFTSQDIKNIRKKTGLTQSLFAKVLNMGEATIKRYETGTSLPDGTQLSVLKMLQNDPNVILRFYDENKMNLSLNEQKILSNKLKQLTLNSLMKSSYDTLFTLYSQYENSDFNGFSKFNPEKLFNMISFFSKEGVLKTKLMKLLWYSDFLMYQKESFSISGCPYWHKEFGPVPVEHDTVLGVGTSINYIDINEEEDINTGFTKMIIRSNAPFNDNLFDESELKIMSFVAQYFAEFGSRAISNYSHEEDAWRETEEEELISYSFAKVLNLKVPSN